MKTPTIITLKIGTRSPFSGHPSKGELDDFDQSKSYYHCDIHCDGKVKAAESPDFRNDDEGERFRAYSILRECIAECITRALLPENECPQYKYIDGILTPCASND